MLCKLFCRCCLFYFCICFRCISSHICIMKCLPGLVFKSPQCISSCRKEANNKSQQAPVFLCFKRERHQYWRPPETRVLIEYNYFAAAVFDAAIVMWGITGGLNWCADWCKSVLPLTNWRFVFDAQCCFGVKKQTKQQHIFTVECV